MYSLDPTKAPPHPAPADHPATAEVRSVQPNIGSLWRSGATGSVWRVVSIDLGLVGDCVEMRLVEPSKVLIGEWAGIAQSNADHPSLQGRDITMPEPATLEDMRAMMMDRSMWVELAWFGRAGTFVGEAPQ